MNLIFRKVQLPADHERIVKFLMSERWPYHLNMDLTPEKVTEMITNGIFDGENHECHWIRDTENSDVGFIRLMDLEDIGDGYPLFDLRLRASARGKGYGRDALNWITKYMFTKWANLDRIAGTTRADNIPMRRTFRSCGYVKEGHYRKDWASPAGTFYDTVRYGILREDWESGRTTPVNWNDE